MFKKLGNYFLGLDIIEDYKIRKQENPENIKQLNRERNKYLIIGKAIPNIMDISGIISLSFWQLGPVLISSVLIGGGEGIRKGMHESYKDRQRDYETDSLYQEHTKVTNELISTLENMSEQQKSRLVKALKQQK